MAEIKELAAQLLASSDSRDRVGAGLIEVFMRNERITLADAFAITARLGLAEVDALAAVERLAYPQTAGLNRFYVDRSRPHPKMLEPEEVKRALVSLHGNRAGRSLWASTVEVVWARTVDAAIGRRP